MTFINAARRTDDAYEIFCGRCGRSVAVEDGKYIRWALVTGQVPYCFECDNVSEGDHPAMFEVYWEFVWAFFDANRTAHIMEFDADTGFVTAEATAQVPEGWTLEMLVELWSGAKAESSACPVVHNSTRRRVSNG